MMRSAAITTLRLRKARARPRLLLRKANLVKQLLLRRLKRNNRRRLLQLMVVTTGRVVAVVRMMMVMHLAHRVKMRTKIMARIKHQVPLSC